MPDSVLAFYFGALCALAAAWVATYRAIRRRLAARHPMKFAALVGTAQRRKNGLDKFFAVVGFLFEDQTALHDLRLRLACGLLKALAAGFLLVFVAMMFTPFFLRLER